MWVYHFVRGRSFKFWNFFFNLGLVKIMKLEKKLFGSNKYFSLDEIFVNNSDLESKNLWKSAHVISSKLYLTKVIPLIFSMFSWVHSSLYCALIFENTFPTLYTVSGRANRNSHIFHNSKKQSWLLLFEKKCSHFKCSNCSKKSSSIKNMLSLKLYFFYLSTHRGCRQCGEELSVYGGFEGIVDSAEKKKHL